MQAIVLLSDERRHANQTAPLVPVRFRLKFTLTIYQTQKFIDALAY